MDWRSDRRKIKSILHKSFNQNQMNETNTLVLLKEALPELKAIMGLNASPGTDIETMALQELEYLKNISMTKHEILDCLPESVIAAVKSTMKKNLTLDPDAGLVYVMTRNVYVLEEGKKVKRKVLEIKDSTAGKISVARQCGRILDIKQPRIFYTADEKTEKIEVEILKPSVPSPRWEVLTFDKIHFSRWKSASHRQNSMFYEYLSDQEKEKKPKPDAETCNWANALYTSFNGGIDPEFAATKAIGHALNGKRLGTNLNERVMNRIEIKDIKHVVINPTVDMTAAADDAGISFEAAEIVQENESALPQEALPTSDDL